MSNDYKAENSESAQENPQAKNSAAPESQIKTEPADEVKQEENQNKDGNTGEVSSFSEENGREEVPTQAAAEVPVPPYGTPPPAFGRFPKPVRKPKEKLPLGAKILLGALSVVSIGVTVSFITISAIKLSHISFSDFKNVFRQYMENQYVPNNDFPIEDPFDWEKQELPEPEEPKEKPNIQVAPNNQGIVIHSKPKTEPLSAAEVYEKVVQSTVTVEATLYLDEYQQNSEPNTGTGIIATSDGYIITNSHVVMNSKSADVKIITHDGKEYDALVVGVDKTTDLAVLKTNDHNFIPAEFGDANELAIGEWVLAIGNPGGARFSSSLTRGIVSGLNRTVGEYSENGMTYIQTDAAINPGNSGGPLVNLYGQVVGINSSKIVSSGYEGMGFAIPTTNAKGIINELFSGGYVKGRTRLGIKGTDVSEQSVYFENLPVGFIIHSLEKDSVFNGTDVQVGDIITAIGDMEVDGVSAIGNALLAYKPGDTVKISLFRPDDTGGAGKRFEVTVTLLEDKGETQ